MERSNVIVDKSYTFALSIIRVHKTLKHHHEYEIGSQLLRSGTSIGANVNEATAAQTKKDFIAKMAIASKEARETRYWLNLIKDSRIVEIETKELLNDVTELISILTAIVKTAQKS